MALQMMLTHFLKWIYVFQQRGSDLNSLLVLVLSNGAIFADVCNLVLLVQTNVFK